MTASVANSFVGDDEDSHHGGSTSYYRLPPPRLTRTPRPDRNAKQSVSRASCACKSRDALSSTRRVLYRSFY